MEPNQSASSAFKSKEQELEEKEIELQEKETRLISILNTLGHPNLDSIESFICKNSSIHLACQEESLKVNKLREEFKINKNELIYLKDELNFNKILLKNEKERNKELEIELNLLKGKLELKLVSSVSMEVGKLVVQAEVVPTSSSSICTPVLQQDASSTTIDASSGVTTHSNKNRKRAISLEGDSSTPKSSKLTKILTTDQRLEKSSKQLPNPSIPTTSNSTTTVIPKVSLPSPAPELSTPIPTSKSIPKSSNPIASTSKLSINPVPSTLPPLVSQLSASHQDRLAQNYPPLLKSYYELRRSVQNYRLGAMQYVDSNPNPNPTNTIQPSLDLNFDLPDFEDFDSIWTLDGSLKKRFDFLRSKESDARRIQSELRDWKDRLAGKKTTTTMIKVDKKLVSTPTRSSPRKHSREEPSSSKKKEKEKENPIPQPVTLSAQPQPQPLPHPHHQTPTPHSSYSYPKLLGTTPRKGKREEKWLIEDDTIPSTTKKVRTATPIILSSPAKVHESLQQSSGQTTRYDSSSSVNELVEEEEEEQEDNWSLFPPSAQQQQQISHSIQIDSSPIKTSSPPTLKRHRAKNSISKPPSSNSTTTRKTRNSSPQKRISLSSPPPPTFYPSSATSSHSNSVPPILPPPSPAPVSTTKTISRARKSTPPPVPPQEEESTLTELRYYAMMGSPPLPAPNWAKIHEEDRLSREKDVKERDERRRKDARENERKRKAEEEREEERVSRKKGKGGKRRKVVEEEEDVDLKGGRNEGGKLGEGSSKRRIEINPNRNNGKNYHYSEVIRNKEARLDMHAEACDCCTEYYKRELGDSNEQQDGNGNGKKNKFLSERHLAMQAKLQQNSKHRSNYRPNPDPPEYWQLGFPTTQVQERVKVAADVIRADQRAYQEAEAEQANGRYRYAPN